MPTKPVYFYPCLPFVKYSVQPGTGFLDPKYEAAVGALHPGVDYNGLGGGDTDLGDPIFAVGDGQVVAARFYRVWGNIVLIHHPEAKVWSMSAHCKEVLVKVGAQVSAGQKIATIGKGEPDKHHPAGRYLAHLHFEIRKFGPAKIPVNDWPSAKYPNDRPKALNEIKATRLDPQVWLKSVGAKKAK